MRDLAAEGLRDHGARPAAPWPRGSGAAGRTAPGRCGRRRRTPASTASGSGIERPGVGLVGAEVRRGRGRGRLARPRGRRPPAAGRSRRPRRRPRRGPRSGSRPPRRRRCRPRSRPRSTATGRCSGFFMSSVTGPGARHRADPSVDEVGAGVDGHDAGQGQRPPLVSMEVMRAWAYGLRTMPSQRAPGMTRSST